MGKIKRRLQSFSMLPLIPDIDRQIWSLVEQIPRGRVSTYGSIARALGDIAASRHVGAVMMHHDHDEGCPCHRLIRADLTLGKFIGGNVAAKAELLGQDGVLLSGCRLRDAELVWEEFSSIKLPLKRLSEYQSDVAQRVDVTTSLDQALVTVGGVDVSLVPRSDLAVAAFVEIDLEKGEPVYSQTYVAPVAFPYISGYLAFRELPLLLELISHIRCQRSLPAVTMVDGSGILHPRRSGVATMLGMEMNMVTVGLTKKHLLGSVDLNQMGRSSCRQITVDGELCGFATLPASGTAKPLFVSPGHGIDIASSLTVMQACRGRHRLPEPIYWADRISRSVARSRV